ncbi:MAG: D-alanine--D-alanine ligase [Saprospiraceae bacterium]|nr:D-alanine--D-alanine ligase [Saprospiraceae bacterium]MDG2419928.1 D-alanine--D-alanine ligase [Saprospiraceae bacterium]
MRKINIAIITGGIVAERGVSLKSAKTIYDNLNRNKYTPYLVDFDGNKFIEISSKRKLSKVDFSFTKDGNKVKIDLAFLMLHGSPAEDGKLQGYLEIIGIPYTGCDVFVSSLTFDKQSCKTFLKSYNIPMADSQLLRKGEKVNVRRIEKMGFPQFVKPNKNGSSYGITKVNQKSEIKSAVEKAMQFDDEVIVEGFLKGREFSNGVFRKGDKIIVLPITEIISKNDFFDYKAKYENESQEVTPADLSKKDTLACQALSKKIYLALSSKGMMRMDYIRMGKTFYFLEANSIPGFSEQSLFPQQILGAGLSIEEVLDAVVVECMNAIK